MCLKVTAVQRKRPMGEEDLQRPIRWDRLMAPKHVSWSVVTSSYILSRLTEKYGNSIGLYCDDGLSALNKTPQEIEQIKKDICQNFPW